MKTYIVMEKDGCYRAVNASATLEGFLLGPFAHLRHGLAGRLPAFHAAVLGAILPAVVLGGLIRTGGSFPAVLLAGIAWVWCFALLPGCLREGMAVRGWRRVGIVEGASSSGDAVWSFMAAHPRGLE